MNDEDDSTEQRSNGLGFPQWQSFMYISDTVDNRCQQSERIGQSRDTSEESLHSKSVPLSTMEIGKHVRIVSLNCGKSNRRLIEIGLMPDRMLEVVSRTATGSVVVAIESCQVGLSAEIAQRIQVY